MENQLSNISVKDLAIALAIKRLKEIYGEEAIYVNNYDEFRGLVLHDKVREPYEKILNNYISIILKTIKNENKSKL